MTTAGAASTDDAGWQGRAGRRYVILLTLGLWIAVAAGDLAARDLGLSPGRVFVAEMLLLPLGLAGTRAWHLLVSRGGSRERDGAVLIGGLFFMAPASFLLLPLLGLPVGPFWDVAAFAIFAGMPVARLACLGRGCCCGRPSSAPWALHLPDPAGRVRRRLPVQLFESAAALALLAALLAWQPLAPFHGALFLAGAGAYAALRLCLAPLRQPAGGPRLQRAQTAAYAAVATVTLTALSVGALLQGP